MASHPPIQSSNTGGSNTGSQFSSRNPYRPTSADPYYTPQQSPNPTGPSTFHDNNSSTTQPQAATMSQPASDAAQQAVSRPPLPEKPAAYQAQPAEDSEPAPAPALPPRPEAQDREEAEAPARDLPQRPSPQSTGQNQETHPGFTAPFQTGSNPSPPRRHLTSTAIASTTIPYARNPTRVTAYLLPLPAPTSVRRKGKGTALDVPQRYLLYTPPAAHLLKPNPATDGKERKRHRLKRVAQQELRKAKTYEGRTVSFKGLHSKTLRGIDWAISGIKSADITFFARVPRKVKDKAAAKAGAVVEELVLMHPPLPAAQRQEDGEEEEVHTEFRAQVGRTQRKARKHSAISVGLFLPAVVVDTLLAIIWPFGGLAEIDAVWAYASLSAWLTARSVQKRLDANAMVTMGEAERETLGRKVRRDEGRSEEGEEGILRPGEDAEERRLSRQVHFREELGANDEKANVKVNGKKTLTVSFVPDEAMRTMESYFQEILHKRNPKAFASPGVPPTKTDVLASIGWWPDRRGRAPDSQNEADWDDENWQTRQAKEDLDKVFIKAAKEWDKWCKLYAKYPERAMKEKGHSKSSEVMRKMKMKKDTRVGYEQPKPEVGSAGVGDAGASGSQAAGVEASGAQANVVGPSGVAAANTQAVGTQPSGTRAASTQPAVLESVAAETSAENGTATGPTPSRKAKALSQLRSRKTALVGAAKAGAARARNR